jgi:hypothetical protein
MLTILILNHGKNSGGRHFKKRFLFPREGLFCRNSRFFTDFHVKDLIMTNVRKLKHNPLKRIYQPGMWKKRQKEKKNNKNNNNV